MPKPTAQPKRAARSSRVLPPRVLTGTVYITRQVHFNSAHRLMNPAKGRKWNEEKFGPCNNPHWHGHNYVMEVTVKGTPDPDTGYIMDLSDLKDVMNLAVANKCDHRNLNTDVDFLRGINPSTENLVIAFWHELVPHIPAPARLHSVRLYETPRNFAEFFGPDVIP